jgi:nucleotide-binding universal stress UspA family protein
MLVVIDPDAVAPSCITRALNLAGSNGAAVTLLTVLEPFSTHLRSVLPGSGREIEDEARKDVLAALDEVSAKFAAQDINVSTAVRIGDVAIESIQEAMSGGHDVVVKNVQSESGSIGGSDMRLLRKCPCPVWLVPREPAPELRCVLAAVDASFADSEEEELSRDILRLATSVAESEHAELHVVHAWTQPGAIYMSRRMKVEEFERFVAEARERHREALDELLHEFDLSVSEPNVHLDAGEPEAVIPACASKYGAQLIVMGTVARAGLSGLLMGNTAERVLQNVRCGVLALKPTGFVSPVRPD